MNGEAMIPPPDRELIHFVHKGFKLRVPLEGSTPDVHPTLPLHGGLGQILSEYSVQGTRLMLPGVGPQHPLRYTGLVPMCQITC